MQIVILPGSRIASQEALHDWLTTAFNFPSYCGRNLAALWDLISATIALPVTLIWQDFAQSQALLGFYADKTRQVFQEAADLQESFYFRIQ